MKKKSGFCGWYFKCQSKEESIALIPAVHTSCGAQSSSIQVISGSGNWNFDLPGGQGYMRRDRPCARLGANRFSEEGICLDLHAPGCSVVGKLRFGKPTPVRYDIMGPFCAVPFMECRHSVFSMCHSVSGTLQINGKEYGFHPGVGYIEGDRGHSFPKQYVWTQCCFEGGSLMLSVAEIPLGPAHFTGIISVVQLEGREYRLATYLGARVQSLQNRAVTVRQGGLTLTAELLDQKAYPLRAPAEGAMARTIRENVACRAHYQLRRKEHILLELETTKASFEYEYH